MCFKRVTDFKILLSIITLFLWVTNVCATSKLIEGSQLKEPLTIDLDFSDTDHLLIRASQYHADYSLELIEKETSTIIRKVNFPFGNDIDEILLVTTNQCKECIVQLTPIEFIDTNSPYSLTIEAIPTTDIAQLAILQSLTLAGEYLQKTEEVINNDREVYLKKSAIELNVVADMDKAAWRNYALLLLAYIYRDSNNIELLKETLVKLLDETTKKISNFRAYASVSYTHLTLPTTPYV